MTSDVCQVGPSTEMMNLATLREYAENGRRCQPVRRGVKWSQVAPLRIGPLTNLQPPIASGGNMYLQRAHLTSGVGAGR